MVDFIIFGPGLLRPVALYVDGPYWHRSRVGKTGKEMSDKLIRARLEEMGYTVKVMGKESATYEGALKWIRENIA